MTINRLISNKIKVVLSSASIELEDLTITFIDKSSVDYVLYNSRGIVWQVKLKAIVNMIERT